jgi:hypothetical protein
MHKSKTEWGQNIDAINAKLLQLHALSKALYICTVHLSFGDETASLAKLSLELCEEVENLVAKVECDLRVQLGLDTDEELQEHARKRG